MEISKCCWERSAVDNAAMRHHLAALLIALAAATSAASQETIVRQQAELIHLIGTITAGQADLRYYVDEDLLQIRGKTLVTGTQSGLSSRAFSAPCHPTLLLRFVPFIKPEQLPQRRTDLEAAQAQAHEEARQKMSPSTEPSKLGLLEPTTAGGWLAHLNSERATKALDDLPTHHWRDHGIVVVRTYLVKPAKAEDPAAFAMDALVQKILAQLTAY